MAEHHKSYLSFMGASSAPAPRQPKRGAFVSKTVAKQEKAQETLSYKTRRTLNEATNIPSNIKSAVTSTLSNFARKIEAQVKGNAIKALVPDNGRVINAAVRKVADLAPTQAFDLTYGAIRHLPLDRKADVLIGPKAGEFVRDMRDLAMGVKKAQNRVLEPRLKTLDDSRSRLDAMKGALRTKPPQTLDIPMAPGPMMLGGPKDRDVKPVDMSSPDFLNATQHGKSMEAWLQHANGNNQLWAKTGKDMKHTLPVLQQTYVDNPDIGKTQPAAQRYRDGINEPLARYQETRFKLNTDRARQDAWNAADQHLKKNVRAVGNQTQHPFGGEAREAGNLYANSPAAERYTAGIEQPLSRYEALRHSHEQMKRGVYDHAEPMKLGGPTQGVAGGADEARANAAAVERQAAVKQAVAQKNAMRTSGMTDAKRDARQAVRQASDAGRQPAQEPDPLMREWQRVDPRSGKRVTVRRKQFWR